MRPWFLVFLTWVIGPTTKKMIKVDHHYRWQQRMAIQISSSCC